MPNEDFNIKVVTTADTSGIQQTAAGMEALKQQAEKIRQDAGAQALKTPAAPEKDLSFSGSALGIGTIITLLTGAISKWKEFNAEQDRAVDNAIKAAEKMRELGDAILDMQDKARNAARVGVEPLYQSFIRLQQEIIRLKTEQSLLNLPNQGKEWEKLNAEISTDAALLSKVTSALKANEEQAKKTKEANDKAAESFLKGAVETASPQTQAVLKNEEAARKAREAGDQKSADQYQKTADQFKASMTQAQRDEYEGLQAAGRKPIGRRAGVGESQDAVDDVELNKLNNDIVQHGGKPVTKEQAARLNSDMLLQDIITELKQQTAIWR
jgi:hypothetical protein